MLIASNIVLTILFIAIAVVSLIIAIVAFTGMGIAPRDTTDALLFLGCMVVAVAGIVLTWTLGDRSYFMWIWLAVNAAFPYEMYRAAVKE